MTSEFDDLELPESFAKAKELGTIVEPQKEPTIESVRPQARVDSKDYCIGFGPPGMVRICEVDPITHGCGYKNCVDIPRNKMKRKA